MEKRTKQRVCAVHLFMRLSKIPLFICNIIILLCVIVYGVGDALKISILRINP